MKNRKNYTIIGIIALVSLLMVNLLLTIASTKSQAETRSISVHLVGTQILATGSVHSENEAVLHFQTGGKLVYLPFKEGDTVFEGQTIAQLDTYSLEQQLDLMANNYQVTKNAFDQAQENQNAGVLEGQQRTALDQTNKSGYSVVPETNVIYDNVKRIVDNAQIAQDSAQININLANYALQLASLTSPFNGVVTHEDVNVVNVNITQATSFIISDPNTIVFRADVPSNLIDFVSVGAQTSVRINGISDKVFNGIVVKIYPQKITLPQGQDVYEVDIQLDELGNQAKFGQTGSVLIQSNTRENIVMVPAWTILSQNYVWILENNKPVLKKVKIGKVHGSQVEVVDGLRSSDKVIVNPESIAVSNYKIL